MSGPSGVRVGACIRLLQEREWTKRELAREMGVSERSVKRYLQQIETAGWELSIREVELDQNLRHYSLRR